MAKTYLIKTFFILSILINTLYANQKHIYQTYYPWESDSILVAWIIKKHIDSDAKFIAMDKNSTFGDQTINTANSKIQRNARYTAFEIALKQYKIKKDHSIKKLIKAIKVLEMAAWKKAAYPTIMRFENNLLENLPPKKSVNDLKNQFDIIDNFCKGQN